MKTEKGRLSISLYFTFIVMGELLAIFLIAAILQWFLDDVLRVELNVHPVVWVIPFCFIIGSAITSFLNHRFFQPIQKLSQAMAQVSQGDFTPRLETKSVVREVRDTYANFNLMAEALSATETLQADFISGVSHEFKTPINAIEGYSMLLQGNPDANDTEKIYVDKILFNTRRLSKLVGNVLLLSKIGNQGIQSMRRRFRLDEQIRQAIVALEQEWSSRDIAFDVEMESVTYEGYEDMIYHVWSNLIGNAIKFSPQGGSVQIRLDVRDRDISFTVDDEGPGIPPEIQKHIFNKFYQGDTSHKEEGNGLGLALVKQIVALEGGKVETENLPTGGCRFTVLLHK